MSEEVKNVLEDITVSPELVIMNLEASTDLEAIDKLARLLYEKGMVKESYIQSVKDREEVFSTGLGFAEMGVAIPHTDSDHVIHQAIAIGILKEPVDFCAMGQPIDKVPVRLMFMLAIQKPDKQLDFLSKMIDAFQTPGNLMRIYTSQTPEQAAERLQQCFV